MIPDLSVLWVIFFVLLLATILNGLLFKPLIRVMTAREAAVASARQLAERAATQARQASDEFDARTRDARAELYRQMEDARRAALERRTQLLADTRQQAEASIAEATARLRAEAAEARSRLDRDAEPWPPRSPSGCLAAPLRRGPVHHPAPPPAARSACESWRKLARVWAGLALCVVLWAGVRGSRASRRRR